MMTTPTQAEVAALEAAGLVTVRPHSALPLRIVNYTPRAQYERAWTPALLQCRGLVYDDAWKLVARPLPKFFNYEEHLGAEPAAGPLPTGLFTVTEKYDGSLGIVFRWQEHVLLATRGSFHCEQAEKGMQMLYLAMVEKRWRFPNEGTTHLFEIIYPANRIVVDYGKEERLQWLTSLDNETGRELPHYGGQYGGITSHMADDPLQLRCRERVNAEGYVLRYANGQRVKIKHETYVALHRLVSGLSTTSIWEVLRDGGNPLEALVNLPDEWYGWAQRVEKELTAAFQELRSEVEAEFARIIRRVSAAFYEGDNVPFRRAFATEAKLWRHPQLLFLKLDDNDERLRAAIWKVLEPERNPLVIGDEC